MQLLCPPMLAGNIVIRINAIAAENLRGYHYTRLKLDALTVLVGENNEGKSSILKMLERFLQIDDKFWAGDRSLDKTGYDFWYPANEARHKARRLTLEILFTDGRVARRFGLTKGGLIKLRFAISSSGFCRLNTGSPRRNESHDSAAEKLIQRLKKDIRLVLLPPVRDAHSSSFAEKVAMTVKQSLAEKMSHTKRAGAPKEYRLTLEVIRKLEDIVALNTKELSKANDSPLSSMLRSSEVRVDLFPGDIYDLIQKSLFLYLSTGDHDELKVSPGEVGNGLQSLIDIGMTMDSIAGADSYRSTILIVEEPEAFLHPSAQRQFMQHLRGVLRGNVQAVLTTHSPIIVDEAAYNEIVLVRNQRHFHPTIESEKRVAINTSLMTAASAEMFFARTVVFVEGEGDRAFFNTLFRRIRAKSRLCPELSALVFQTTGGCTFYSPWLRLARSYKGYGEDPFNCVWIMDGDSAADDGGQRPLLRAAQDCEFNLSAADTQALIAFGDLKWDVASRAPKSVNDANAVLVRHGGHLFCVDLEWALFNESTVNTQNALKRALTKAEVLTDGDSIGLARRLGSKIDGGSSSKSAKKSPFVRALIAEELDLAELPPEVRIVSERILRTCFRTDERFAEFTKTSAVRL